MSASVLEQAVRPIAPKPARRTVFAPSGHTILRSTGRLPSDDLDLPSTAQLLTEGGDARIACGPAGANRYGCSATPEPELLAFGSSTASTISLAGFRAADALRTRLQEAAKVEPSPVTYERELDRVRRELKLLCGIEKLPGTEMIFGASGTDLHLFASQLMVDTDAPAPLIIRVEANETGRGVPDALAGRHFSECAALGEAVRPNAPLDCGRPIEICEVKCRTGEGSLRPAATVDAEVADAVVQAVKAGRRVLLTVVDVSKTGVIAPSPACVADLKQRFSDSIEILVDACQFRLAPSTLSAYLEHDFIVAITGSKFITGPTFCGALLVPEGAARRLRVKSLPHALKSYSTRADWPQNWSARATLHHIANYGLLLRWEAALTELRAFRQLPEADVTEFLQLFAAAVTKHLVNSPAFEMVEGPALDRGPIAIAASWDQVPTIFSFLLRRTDSSGKRTWLSPDETKQVHEWMREGLGDQFRGRSGLLMSLRCQLGQPVPCGTREGKPVSALRLCVSSRLVVEALSPTGRGRKAVIAEALAALDKAAQLAS